MAADVGLHQILNIEADNLEVSDPITPITTTALPSEH